MTLGCLFERSGDYSGLEIMILAPGNISATRGTGGFFET